VPEGLSGEYNLRLKYDVKPFAVEASEAKISL